MCLSVLFIYISQNSCGKEELILWQTLKKKLKVICVPLKFLNCKQKRFKNSQAKGELLECIWAQNQLQTVREVVKQTYKAGIEKRSNQPATVTKLLLLPPVQLLCQCVLPTISPSLLCLTRKREHHIGPNKSMSLLSVSLGLRDKGLMSSASRRKDVNQDFSYH